jgi:hypothetical protein
MTDPVEAPTAHPRFAAALAANLRAAFALSILRARGTDSLHPFGAQLLALLVLNLAAGLAYDFYAVGFEQGRFDLSALPAVSFWALAALISAWLVSALRRDDSIVPPLTTAAFGIALIAGLAADALAIAADFSDPLDRAYPWLAWIPAAWAGIAYARAAHRWAPAGGWRSLAIVAVAVLSMLAPQWVADPSLRLWVGPDAAEPDAAGEDAPESEQTFYRQADMLDQALDSIAAGRAGVTELYTVAFAGDGSQEVFINEAEGADRVLAEVFGTADRGIVLANSASRPQEAPFATATALERALETIADRMDRDEDILLLLLTSHGGPDHTLEVSLPPYRFESLTPARLRSMLDRAGIRYRVVVVSACYSGGFIEPLASPETMVITASSADRASFGCRDGGDWTDFGRAFFEDGVAQTASLEEAFQRASRLVAQREAAERLTPSQPQIFVGDAIRERLRSLEAIRPGGVLFALGK